MSSVTLRVDLLEPPRPVASSFRAAGRLRRGPLPSHSPRLSCALRRRNSPTRARGPSASTACPSAPSQCSRPRAGMPARSVGPSTSVASGSTARASSSIYKPREDVRHITVHGPGRPRGVTFDASRGLEVRGHRLDFADLAGCDQVRSSRRHAHPNAVDSSRATAFRYASALADVRQRICALLQARP